MGDTPLVSFGLPVYNGADTVESVVRAVLRQDYENLELLISDNGSTDETEIRCRDLARTDDRIRYYRQDENIGQINNFRWTAQHARGALFRWIGDGDEVSKDYTTRCVTVFSADPRLILVTTQFEYSLEDGSKVTMPYLRTDLADDDPVVRFRELLRLLTETFELLDPIYGMSRREAVAAVPLTTVPRGDETYAAKLALTGPFGHIPEVMAYRGWKLARGKRLRMLLGAPAWQSRFENVLQCRELLDYVGRVELTPVQRRAAQGAVAQFYVRRHAHIARRRAKRLVRLAAERRPDRNRHPAGDSF